MHSTASLSSHSVLPHPLPSHPRLLATESDWQRLRDLVKSDAASARIFKSLQQKSRELLEIGPSERIMDGYRMLYVSRRVLERISVLAMVFKIEGNSRLAKRAIEELVAVCKFTDWNPSHYLDTAEMSLAVAIGYDWLHDQLSFEERDLIADALLQKGIMPSTLEPEQWFIRGNNNWNQVCHAGMTAAAIAIADRHPDVAEEILRRGIDNLHYSADAYAPDGAYPEGPMYWNYGTSFHVVMAAALERLTGSTLGTDAYPGFAESADYVVQMTTPTGNFYDYADCRASRHTLIPLFWFARRFQRPDWLGPDLKKLSEDLDRYDSGNYDDSNYRLLPLVLLWRDPALIPDHQAVPPRHWLGQGPMPVASFRSEYENPNALYAAIKGGSPSLNHAHMDGGSFMVEADGITWATDLGMHFYEPLEQVGVNLWDASEEGTRWKIFRLGAEGHSILRFNNARQVLKGNGQFIKFEPKGENPGAVLDLSPLYENQVQSVQRGLMLVDHRAVLIQDEWTPGATVPEVTWQMITPADISIESGQAVLSRKGKICRLLVLDSLPILIEYQEASALQHPKEIDNPGIKRITIRISPEAARSGRLRVLLVPESGNFTTAPALQPLAEWASGTF